jgi:murein DD-endopeptidase MepM/ murein hydrolase activator NlpD
MALVTDGFDFPMGTDDERRSLEVPPGRWLVTNPYLNYYCLGPGKTNPAYHTGADILIEPGGGMGEPIHACANGEIVFAQRISNSSWGNLIVQRCTLPDRRTLYIRHAHENPMYVNPGDLMVRGQKIALESDAFGRFYPHCHLDFSLTAVLAAHPADWPGLNRDRIERDYIDPIQWIKEHRPLDAIGQQIIGLAQQIETLAEQIEPPAPEPPPPDPHPEPPSDAIQMIATDNVRVRSQPTTDSPQVVVNGSAAWVSKGTEATIKDTGIVANGYHWGQLFSPYQGYSALEFFVKKA